MIRTRKGKLLIACGVLVFLVLSALLARWLAVENIERDDIVTLLQAEARGDANAMLAQLDGCDQYCRANVVRMARRLKRPGQRPDPGRSVPDRLLAERQRRRHPSRLEGDQQRAPRGAVRAGAAQWQCSLRARD